MEIIDAQIHDPHPVAQLDPKYKGDFELLLAVEMAREAMDSVGVDRALMQTRQELLDVAIARYPERFAGCSGFDVKQPDVDERVKAYRDRPGMLAVRMVIVQWRTAEGRVLATRQLLEPFASGSYEPFFVAAEKYNLPVFLGAMAVPKAVEPVAQSHPNLTIIVDHIGLAATPAMQLDPDPWQQLPDVLNLAKYPNVSIKLSAPNALSKQPYPHADIWPSLHKLLKAFGPERLLFASDYTRLRFAPGTTERGNRSQWAALYSDSVNYLRDTKEISEKDKEMIFAGAIRKQLRWPKTTSAPHA